MKILIMLFLALGSVYFGLQGRNIKLTGVEADWVLPVLYATSVLVSAVLALAVPVVYVWVP